MRDFGDGSPSNGYFMCAESSLALMDLMKKLLDLFRTSEVKMVNVARPCVETRKLHGNFLVKRNNFSREEA